MGIVKTQNLTKIYGQDETAVTALNSVNLCLEAGEFVAVMGPSGCGKSTLLHLIGGLDQPTSGSVFVENNNLTQLDDNTLTKLRRRKIGFIFQFYNLIPVLGAAENVALPLILDGGRTAGNLPSTVIDCTKDEVVILREGPISLEEIKRVLEN